MKLLLRHSGDYEMAPGTFHTKVIIALNHIFLSIGGGPEIENITDSQICIDTKSKQYLLPTLLYLYWYYSRISLQQLPLTGVYVYFFVQYIMLPSVHLVPGDI